MESVLINIAYIGRVRHHVSLKKSHSINISEITVYLWKFKWKVYQFARSLAISCAISKHIHARLLKKLNDGENSLERLLRPLAKTAPYSPLSRSPNKKIHFHYRAANPNKANVSLPATILKGKFFSSNRVKFAIFVMNNHASDERF